MVWKRISWWRRSQSTRAVTASPGLSCDNRPSWSGRRHVADLVGRPAIGILGLAGVGDRSSRAVGQHQHAAVAGLAAAERIEHGAIEHDAVLADARYDGVAFAQVGVLAEQILRSWPDGSSRHFRGFGLQVP